jgi:hypothetical protein
MDVPHRGVVHSVFRRAVNLSFGSNLWTMLAEDKSDLPFGIRVTSNSFEGLDVQRGDPVNVRAGFVGVGSRLVVDCRAANRWSPPAANVTKSGMEGRLSVIATAVRGRSWPGSVAMANAVRSAIDDPTRLRTILADVVGQGPGATPSGDDVLVGVLAVLTSPHSGPAGRRLGELIDRLLEPLLPNTTEVSGHLLRQAAKAWFSRDLHELMAALVESISVTELNEKVRRVIETGATSGADTCEGVLAFAPLFLLA